MQLTPIGGVPGQVAQVLAHLRGPVAQFSPIRSMPSGSSAVSAAPISEPSSMVPVVSTVTCTMIGRSRPACGERPLGAEDGGLGLQQVLAGLDQDRVDATGRACPRPGPGRRHEAARTPRGPGWAAWCQDRRCRAPTAAGRACCRRPPTPERSGAAALASSKIRSEIPYSPSADRLVPNVFVSTRPRRRRSTHRGWLRPHLAGSD